MPRHAGQIEVDLGRSLAELVALEDRRHGAVVFLEGDGEATGWRTGRLLGLGIEPGSVAVAGEVEPALAAVERRIEERRRDGGPAETGVAVLLAYDALTPWLSRRPGGRDLPALFAFEVDVSLRQRGEGRLLLTGRDADRCRARLEESLGAAASGRLAAHVTGTPRTSLPQAAYLRAVESVKRHIRAGDVYQANLSQMFTAPFDGCPYALYRAAVGEHAAPRSAFVRAGDLALASLSPEVFLRSGAADGTIETWPIKGTRARSPQAELDGAAAAELLGSAKDRAELLMIVDLERNDLSRVCVPGTVQAQELATLRSYATVHHLVACVTGRLRVGVGPLELLRATFPGGSITGAPKRRAMQILDEHEPNGRDFFTGSLLWFGDDGAIDSSILIRSAVFARGRVGVGAGGGVVADSEAEQEWLESNLKARPLARALGFDPEEAT